MCSLCLGADANMSDAEKRYARIDALAQAFRDHPWEFKLAPMSPEERLWFDLDSPLRKK